MQMLKEMEEQKRDRVEYIGEDDWLFHMHKRV